MMRAFAYLVNDCSEYHIMCGEEYSSTSNLEVALDCAIGVSLSKGKIAYILCDGSENRKYLYRVYAESNNEFYVRQLN